MNKLLLYTFDMLKFNYMCYVTGRYDKTRFTRHDYVRISVDKPLLCLLHEIISVYKIDDHTFE